MSGDLSVKARLLIHELAEECVSYEAWRRNVPLLPSTRFPIELQAAGAIQQCVVDELKAVALKHNWPAVVRQTPPPTPQSPM